MFLVSGTTGKHTQEVRHLRFWFKPSLTEREQAKTAQDFFKELVAPLDFPRGETKLFIFGIDYATIAILMKKSVDI